MYLSLDEWNVWYIKNMNINRREYSPSIAEDIYSLMDALVVGGLLCTLVNNSDRVKMACLAQLVNALAPIHTDPNGGVLKHTTYYPFKQVSNYARGKVYKNLMVCDKVITPKYGEVPILQSISTFDKKTGSLVFFILNTNQEDSVQLKIDIKEFGEMVIEEHQVLMGEDLFAVNSFDNPENVIPINLETCQLDTNDLMITLPKLSWHMLRLKVNTELSYLY